MPKNERKWRISDDPNLISCVAYHVDYLDSCSALVVSSEVVRHGGRFRFVGIRHSAFGKKWKRRIGRTKHSVLWQKISIKNIFVWYFHLVF